MRSRFSTSVLSLLLVVFAMTSGCASRRTQGPPDPLDRIPAEWIELPDAPFVARMREGKAVLVNCTRHSFRRVAVGCVQERNQTVHVVGGLFQSEVYDSDWRHKRTVDGLLRMVNNIDWYVANQERILGRSDLIKRCQTGSRVAVTAVRGDRHTWDANGTRWPK
jgi:hypothetical protein